MSCQRPPPHSNYMELAKYPETGTATKKTDNITQPQHPLFQIESMDILWRTNCKQVQPIKLTHR